MNQEVDARRRAKHAKRETSRFLFYRNYMISEKAREGGRGDI